MWQAVFSIRGGAKAWCQKEPFDLALKKKTGRLRKPASGHFNENQERILKILVQPLTGTSQTFDREVVSRHNIYLEVAWGSVPSLRYQQLIFFPLNNCIISDVIL